VCCRITQLAHLEEAGSSNGWVYTSGACCCSAIICSRDSRHVPLGQWRHCRQRLSPSSAWPGLRHAALCMHSLHAHLLILDSTCPWLMHHCSKLISCDARGRFLHGAAPNMVYIVLNTLHVHCVVHLMLPLLCRKSSNVLSVSG
jgi:hypothetical protein